MTNDLKPTTYYFSDAAGGGLEVWHPVVLASLPSQCLDIPPHREPREVYLETLFAPEFFCPATLQKGKSFLSFLSFLFIRDEATLSERVSVGPSVRPSALRDAFGHAFIFRPF